jgi:hypothetical protein
LECQGRTSARTCTFKIGSSGPNQNPLQCDVQFSPSTSGAIAVTATYGGDYFHGSSSGTFTIFVGTSTSEATALSVNCDQTYPEVGLNDNCHTSVTSANRQALTGTVTWTVSPIGSVTFTQGPPPACAPSPGPAPPPGGPGNNGRLMCNASSTAPRQG